MSWSCGRDSNRSEYGLHWTGAKFEWIKPNNKREETSKTKDKLVLLSRKLAQRLEFYNWQPEVSCLAHQKVSFIGVQAAWPPSVYRQQHNYRAFTKLQILKQANIEARIRDKLSENIFKTSSD